MPDPNVIKSLLLNKFESLTKARSIFFIIVHTSCLSPNKPTKTALGKELFLLQPSSIGSEDFSLQPYQEIP